MRNILKIFISDARRLATNVVAVVVIMGLSVIPSLYAWFNILSNWDPYGESATANINVVVASCDKGVEMEGVELNIGDMVVSNLKENKTIGWVFVDTEQEAVDGVYSGDYYAALVIDETFSADLISFLGGNLENPKITYYENEKKNAIAPKITGKVKTTVQEEINSAFVSTIAESIIKASENIVSYDTEGTVTSSVMERMRRLDADINTYIAIMDSYIAVIDSASNLMEASKEVTKQLESVMAAGRSIANSANTSVNTATDSVDTVSDVITKSLDDLAKQMENMGDMVDALLTVVSNTGTISTGQIQSVKSTVSTAYSRYNAEMERVNPEIKDSCKEQMQAVDTDFKNILKDLDDLEAASQNTSTNAKEISQQIQKDFDTCRESIDALNRTYKNTVEPQLNTTMRSIQTSIAEIQQILNYSSDSVTDVAAALGSYPEMMAFGRDKLIASRDAAKQMEEKLQQLMGDMENIKENDQYAAMISLIGSDPKRIADFISRPVNLEQQPVYAIENNGSATAPFYIVLSIWFGALILVAIIHTGLEKNPGCDNLKNYQKFFGRYIVFYLIGQLQTIITVFGTLLYVGIQCRHPFLFWLAASFTSFTFTLFLYSLAYALGNVGEAAAVILMVIQVAGSGGTFPVEVLPKVFQIMYKYMPFAHGMNALRETIAGMQGCDYWKCLASLLAYIAVALLFGLVISIPFNKLNVKVEESKEKTDLLL